MHRSAVIQTSLTVKFYFLSFFLPSSSSSLFFLIQNLGKAIEILKKYAAQFVTPLKYAREISGLYSRFLFALENGKRLKMFHVFVQSHICREISAIKHLNAERLLHACDDFIARLQTVFASDSEQPY